MRSTHSLLSAVPDSVATASLLLTLHMGDHYDEPNSSFLDMGDPNDGPNSSFLDMGDSPNSHPPLSGNFRAPSSDSTAHLNGNLEPPSPTSPIDVEPSFDTRPPPNGNGF